MSLAAELGQKFLLTVEYGIAAGEITETDAAAALSTALGFFCLRRPGQLAAALQQVQEAARGDFHEAPMDETVLTPEAQAILDAQKETK